MWKLVWAEEFLEDGFPNPEFWSFEEGDVRNNELQWYTSNRLKNCRIEHSQLILEAHKESYHDKNYTSASVITKGKKEFLYGKLVVRAKLPKGRGIWPAIWTLGADIDATPWPLCGEIDIMEFVGYDPEKVHANIHTKAFNHNLETNKGDYIKVDDVSKVFHDYSIVWKEDQIDFYFDEKCYFSFEKPLEASEKEWPFNAPQYLLINLAIGGFWGGKKGIDDSIFPQQFIIDSIKYYKRNNHNI